MAPHQFCSFLVKLLPKRDFSQNFHPSLLWSCMYGQEGPCELSDLSVSPGAVQR